MFPALIHRVLLVFVLSLFLLLILSLVASGPLTGCGEQPEEHLAPEQKGELLFSDEFDGTSLDPDKWTTCYWWGDGGCTISSNEELEWYQPGNVLVEDGLLKLRAKEEQIQVENDDGSFTVYDYTSGVVTTGRSDYRTSSPARFLFEYGYAEIRARVPEGKGMWPAFWILPADHNSKPEIDVMENYGDETSIHRMNFHFINNDGDVDKDGERWEGPDFSADFHTYAVDWRPNAIIWYVDGIERWRYTDKRYIPKEPMYLLLNLAVGGIGPGAPDSSTTFPIDYEIDYVRVWSTGHRDNP
jgi:beta-glucanase (GH16 family)